MSGLRPPYSTTASSRRQKKRRGNDDATPSLAPVPTAARAPLPPPPVPVTAPTEAVDASRAAAAAAVVHTPAAAAAAAAARPATAVAVRAGTRISFDATAADGSTPIPHSVRVPVSGSPGVSTTSSISASTQRASLSLDEEAAAANNTENECGELSTRDIVRMALIDQMQEGDGGDSDDEDDAAIDLDRASERDLHAGDEFDQGTARGVDLEDMMTPHNAIPGAPDGWTPPGPPDGWSPKQPKDTCPDFNEVDNPGQWSPFALQAKYQKGTGKYLGHYMPGGAKVLPKDEDTGKRTVGGWEAHYNGWAGDNQSHRSGACKDDIMPEERGGKLDAELLERMGMSKDRITKKDALFFHQLIFPICDPKKSGIIDDPRKPYYTSVSHFTNLYAYAETNAGTGYGHAFTPTTPSKLLQWDGCNLRDAVRGGNGNIHRRYIDNDPDYDPLIADNMTYTRYLQLKGKYKLNNNQTTPKRGEPNYNPAAKYDMIYDVMVSNVNAMTLQADLDLALDESTWSNMGFGGEALYRHLVKNIGLFYVSWKFWHAPMRHAKSMGAVAAYEMYRECAEGCLRAEWKADDGSLMNLRQYQLRLSEQQLTYHPANKMYPGDQKLRDCTKQHKKRGKKRSSDDSANTRTSYDGKVKLEDLLKACGENGRCCNDDFQKLRRHLNSVHHKKNSSKCNMCGRPTYWVCRECNEPVHILDIERGRTFDGGKCFMDFHDKLCYGLAWCDAPLKKNWRPPNQTTTQTHARYIKRIVKEKQD